MSTLARFTEAAAMWNSLRYKQEFNLELTLALIKEELAEYEKAEDLVEQVDALCDICFIAAGALWKLDSKLDVKTFESFYSFYQLQDIHITEAINHIVAVARNFPGRYLDIVSMHQVLACAFDLLSYKLADKTNAIKALLIISESNSTKSTKTIPTGEKYSSEGKGLEYVAPTAALIQLIAGIEK